MLRSLRSHRVFRSRPLSSRRMLSTTAPFLAADNHDFLPTSRSPIVPNLQFFNSVTGGQGQIPTYRVLDGVGVPIEGAQIPEVGLTKLR